AILHMPISYPSSLWESEHITGLRALNYAALACEPLLPLMAVLSTRRRLKYALLAILIGFHSFILFTMKLPFANLACIASAVILFRDELMKFVVHAPAITVTSHFKRSASEIVAIALVALLSLAMLSSVGLPNWRQPFQRGDFQNGAEGLGPAQRVLFASLWA